MAETWYYYRCVNCRGVLRVMNGRANEKPLFCDNCERRKIVAFQEAQDALAREYSTAVSTLAGEEK